MKRHLFTQAALAIAIPLLLIGGVAIVRNRNPFQPASVHQSTSLMEIIALAYGHHITLIRLSANTLPAESQGTLQFDAITDKGQHLFGLVAPRTNVRYLLAANHVANATNLVVGP